MNNDLEEIRMEFVDCELTDYIEDSIRDSYPNMVIEFVEEILDERM